MSTSFTATHHVLEQIPTAIVSDTLEPGELESIAKVPHAVISLPRPVPAERRGTPRISRIAIKTDGRILFIDVADVIAVEAEGNYVLLHHKTSAHLLRESISGVEEKLSDCGFLRIHRSVLVNVSKVEEVTRLATGEHILRVKNGREYTVTRTYRHNLRNLSPTCLGGEL